MSAEVIPLTVRVSDGSVAPPALVEKRTATTREEILTGLSTKERMLVYACVAAIEESWERRKTLRLLLRAFSDATGVDYVGSAWEHAG